ncbi:hypothetical protein HT031_003068 [Scenedesmus sp. PABB004]|nr:hypothetical protein HT031_003068 [Scenedesmus sp. PABB004]
MAEQAPERGTAATPEAVRDWPGTWWPAGRRLVGRARGRPAPSSLLPPRAPQRPCSDAWTTQTPGATPRELNAAHCGLGNEGLKLFAHTCMLQAACSWCAPRAARRRVHSARPVGSADAAPADAALRPRSMCLGLPLVAWLAALQRQRVAARHAVQEGGEPWWAAAACFPLSLLQVHALLHELHGPPQPAAGSDAPALKPPRVQQMTATESLLQAPSQAQSVAGPLTSNISTSRLLRAVHTHSVRSESIAPRRDAGSRLGDSVSSDTSSGVVDNPYGCNDERCGEDDEALHEGAAGAAAAAARKQQQEQEQLDVPGGLPACAGSSSRLAASVEGPLHLGPACLSARSVGGRWESPRPSSHDAAGGEAAPLPARRRSSAAGSSARPQLPPKPRSSLRERPGSAAGAVSGPPVPQQAVSPEPGGSKAPSPGGGAQPAATGGAARERRSAFGPAASAELSGSRLSLAAAKMQLSQEDVPLLAIKPSPNRRSEANGLSGTRGTLAKAALTGSWRGDGPPGAASAASGDVAAPPAEAIAAAAQEQRQQLLEPAQVGTVQQCDSICNYASWLGAGPSALDLGADPASCGQQQQQQEEESPAGSQPPTPPPQRQASRGGGSAGGSSSEEEQLPPMCRQDSDQPAAALGGAGVSPIASGAVARRDARRPPPSVLASAAQGGSSGGGAPGAGVGLLAPRARMSDWAYMSDLCNLGGSFEANCSGGLAAALGRLAEQGGHSGGGGAAEGEPSQEEPAGTPANGAQRGSAQRRSAAARPAASGSWPDANPSPSSTSLHNTLESQPASGGAAAAASAPAAARGAPAGGASPGAAAASGGARGAAAQLDRATLAAVTGTSGAEALTASQEELAAKLARLAFASPGAAAALAAQQQQRGGHPRPSAGGGWAGCVEDEPFYPTMMSDVCNLADLEDPLFGGPSSSAGGGGGGPSSGGGGGPSGGGAARAVAAAAAAAQRQSRHARGAGGSAGGARRAPLGGGSSGGGAAGPLQRALLARGGQAPPPGGPRAPGGPRQVGGPRAPAGGADSFDSFAPGAGVSYASVDAAPGAPRPGRLGKTFTVTDGGVVETPGVGEFAGGGDGVVVVNPLAGGSPLKSPRRAGGAPLRCESAAAAAERGDADCDVGVGWRPDSVSRGCSLVPDEPEKPGWAAVPRAMSQAEAEPALKRPRLDGEPEPQEPQEQPLAQQQQQQQQQPPLPTGPRLAALFQVSAGLPREPSPGAMHGCRIAAWAPGGGGYAAALASGARVYWSQLELGGAGAPAAGKEGIALPCRRRAPPAAALDALAHAGEVQALALAAAPAADDGEVLLASVDAFGVANLARLTLPRRGAAAEDEAAEADGAAGGAPAPAPRVAAPARLRPADGCREGGWAGVALGGAGGGGLLAATARGFARDVSLYDAASGAAVRSWGCALHPYALTFLPDGVCGPGGLLAVAEGHTVSLWDARAAGCAARVVPGGVGQPLFALGWCGAQGGLLGAAGAERGLYLTEPRKWRQLAKWSGATRLAVHSLAFLDSDPRCAVLAGLDLEVLCGRWDRPGGGGARPFPSSGPAPEDGPGPAHAAAGAPGSGDRSRGGGCAPAGGAAAAEPAPGFSFRGDARWLGVSKAPGADVLAGFAASGNVVYARVV